MTPAYRILKMNEKWPDSYSFSDYAAVVPTSVARQPEAKVMFVSVKRLVHHCFGETAGVSRCTVLYQPRSSDVHVLRIKRLFGVENVRKRRTNDRYNVPDRASGIAVAKQSPEFQDTVRYSEVPAIWRT